MRSRKAKVYTKEQRHFVDKGKIEKYLTCPICQEIFDDPYRITCGHTFCKNCINKWEKKRKEEECPLCREEYIKNFSGKDLIAQAIINDSLVNCIYQGCPWKGKLSELNNHIQTCLFEPGKLPSFMNSINFFKNEKEHKNEKKSEIMANLDDEENDIGNIVSFNYTSSIKERVFAKNPELIGKLFGEKKDEKKENVKIKVNQEKISDREDINSLYNLLSLNIKKEDLNKNKSNKNIFKIDKIDNKNLVEKKQDENKNENEKNLHTSSIMNIFISPTININPNDFLNRKTERDQE